MTNPIFILGTGGHARDVAGVAEALDFRPVFVTRDHADIACWTGAYDIVTEDDAVSKTGEVFAIGIGDNKTRAAIANRLRGTLLFPALVHPDTSLGGDTRAAAEKSEGSVLFAGVRMTNNITFGDFCNVNLGATVSHDVRIGDFATISPGANIAGNVCIGEGAWIGIGAAVNQGNDRRKLAIGAWSVIGSGAVVIKDCDGGATYVGVPARELK